MKFIRERGADRDTRCVISGTALDSAIMGENIDSIRFLVQERFDVNNLNLYGVPLLKWADDNFLDDACDELRKLGALNVTSPRITELQLQASVTWLCQELSRKTASEEWPYWVRHRHWIKLGRCLLFGNDSKNALITLEQMLLYSATKTSWPWSKVDCEECGDRWERSIHLCRDSAKLGIISRGPCLEIHQNELRFRGELENHAYLTYPRPFFSEHIPEEYVAIDEEHYTLREQWLESLVEWKVKLPDHQHDP